MAWKSRAAPVVALQTKLTSMHDRRPLPAGLPAVPKHLPLRPQQPTLTPPMPRLPSTSMSAFSPSANSEMWRPCGGRGRRVG